MSLYDLISQIESADYKEYFTQFLDVLSNYMTNNNPDFREEIGYVGSRYKTTRSHFALSGEINCNIEGNGEIPEMFKRRKIRDEKRAEHYGLYGKISVLTNINFETPFQDILRENKIYIAREYSYDKNIHGIYFCLYAEDFTAVQKCIDNCINGMIESKLMGNIIPYSVSFTVIQEQNSRDIEYLLHMAKMH
jgi:hypothetical protein